MVEAPGFDIIGDVHGCLAELEKLLADLGYDPRTLTHPQGRRLVFLGDYTDRGPKNVACLRLVKAAVKAGHIALMGNHDNKLWRLLKGNNVMIAPGLHKTVAELIDQCDQAERDSFRDFLGSLRYQETLVVQGYPNVTVAHAGIPRSYVGLDAKHVRSHCLYGEVLGFENGLPVRSYGWTLSWAPGDDEPWCVYGHTVVPRPFVLFNTIGIDTGCVYGGKLTALRYPEFDLVFVPAAHNYAKEE